MYQHSSLQQQQPNCRLRHSSLSSGASDAKSESPSSPPPGFSWVTRTMSLGRPVRASVIASPPVTPSTPRTRGFSWALRDAEPLPEPVAPTVRTWIRRPRSLQSVQEGAFTPPSPSARAAAWNARDDPSPPASVFRRPTPVICTQAERHVLGPEGRAVDADPSIIRVEEDGGPVAHEERIIRTI